MTFKKLRNHAGPFKPEFPKTQVVAGTDTEKLVYNFEARVMGYRIEIARGFVFDGASIPRVFWMTTGCPFRPRYRAASLVHDYLYSIKANRKLADLIFKQMLLDAGVSKYTAGKMFRAVRLFGKKAWRK